MRKNKESLKRVLALTLVGIMLFSVIASTGLIFALS